MPPCCPAIEAMFTMQHPGTVSQPRTNQLTSEHHAAEVDRQNVIPFRRGPQRPRSSRDTVRAALLTTMSMPPKAFSDSVNRLLELVARADVEGKADRGTSRRIEGGSTATTASSFDSRRAPSAHRGSGAGVRLLRRGPGLRPSRMQRGQLLRAVLSSSSHPLRRRSQIRSRRWSTHCVA